MDGGGDGDDFLFCLKWFRIELNSKLMMTGTWEISLLRK